MKLLLDKRIEAVVDRFYDNGWEAYAVGGCVRDLLMGRSVHDYDAATNAPPGEIKRLFSDCRTVDTGIKHGTVTVIFDGLPIEVTTYRVESGYSDHRRPDSVSFSGRLADDLIRRDFTVNALAYNDRAGLVDLFGGAEDLQKGILRTVGKADERFGEDALRILRALRFAATLGFSIEDETAEALFRRRGDLACVSCERVYAELRKLSCGDAIRPVLLQYAEIFAEAVPEMRACIGFAQRTKYHIFDVWEHSVRVAENVPAEPDVRLAALFHDIGKPECFSTDADGVGHFYNHASRGAGIADGMLLRLRASAAERERICRLIKLHDCDLLATEKSLRRWLVRLGREELLTLCAIKRADNLAQSPDYRQRLAEIELAEKRIEAADALNRETLGLAITGSDIAAVGAAGAEIGKIKNRLREEIIDGECRNTADALKSEALRLLQEIRRCGIL